MIDRLRRELGEHRIKGRQIAVNIRDQGDTHRRVVASHRDKQQRLAISPV
jgi:hypothetical protein